MTSLGQKIRQRRIEKKLTQGQLAEGLVSASAISQIESDKINPSYTLLCEIAERLEVPLDYFLSGKDEYLEQATSHKLAKTFILAKEYANAVPILDKLYKSTVIDNTDLMMDLATCYIQLKNFQGAHDLLEKVMHLSLREDDNASYIWSLNKLGLLFYEQNNISLALHYWQRGYDFLHDPRQQPDLLANIDTFLRAEVITNLAITHNRLGKFDRSANLFAESLELLKNSTDLNLLAKNYLGLGQSYYGKKEYKLAEQYCQEAITIFKNLDHIHYSINVKQNFAIMRGENGDTDAALHTLYECLHEYQEHNFTESVSDTHSEIAKLLIRKYRLEEAWQHIEAAFQTSQPDSVYQAQGYFVRSMWLAAHDDLHAAIADAKQAAAMFLREEAVHEYSKVCLHQSDVFKKLGDYKSSTEILEQSQLSIQNYFRERGIIL